MAEGLSEGTEKKALPFLGDKKLFALGNHSMAFSPQRLKGNSVVFLVVVWLVAKANSV